MPAISVVIPTYNTKHEYLCTCVNSILQQSFCDYEIIIVDDGSDPCNAKLIDELIVKDERILVLHQKNQGVSVARNNGVKHAKGKYVTFVDADDKVLAGFLVEAFQVAEENDADIVYGFIKRTSGEASDSENKFPLRIKEIDEEWLRKYHIGYLYEREDVFFGRGPCSRLIKADIAKAINFPKGVPIGEDVLWNLEVIKRTRKRYLVDATWYNYIIRDDSVTCKYNPQISDSLMPFYNIVEEDTSIEKQLLALRALRDLKRYVFDIYLGHRENKDSFIKKWKRFNMLCVKEPWKKINNGSLLKSEDKKAKVKYILFRTKLLFLFYYIAKKS